MAEWQQVGPEQTFQDDDMKYRALDANGDYTFGKGVSNFLVNNPDAVAQSVLTRLKLIKGEWFLDNTVGTPYTSQILGAGMVSKYDSAIQGVIASTSGVTGITNYSSQVDPATRKASVSCTISTIYGQANLQFNL